jgi:hypothetical protein
MSTIPGAQRQPVVVHTLSDQASQKYRIAADSKLTSGKQTITFDSASDGGDSIDCGLGASIPSPAIIYIR